MKIRDQRVLGCIAAAIAETGYPPSQNELASRAEYSRAEIRRSLARLVKAGAIAIDPATSRGIKLLQSSPIHLVSERVAVGTEMS